ncbi:Uncharacterised protein [Mycobacteroides abscessus subsp. abscessus]|nr:Uncharacterised protein [Mycobacteroides abscessus subsp. abscessus]
MNETDLIGNLRVLVASVASLLTSRAGTSV